MPLRSIAELPAIARALETLPSGARTHAFVEVPGPAEEQKIDSDVQVVWLHRVGRPVGEALVEAVRALEFPLTAGRAVGAVPGPGLWCAIAAAVVLLGTAVLAARSPERTAPSM